MAVIFPILSTFDAAGVNQAQRAFKGLSGVAKVGTVAFAALGAASLKFGMDAVTAAAADQKAQLKLEKTLQNVTKATKTQTKAVEAFITTQQFATGVSDNQLRPALETLVRATGNVTKAQALLKLGLDVSAGSGRDLESISLALAKAQGGQFTALQRLGIVIPDNIKKSKDFAQVQEYLNTLFGGQASVAANTYTGQLTILKERLGEIQESIGAKLIPKLRGLLEQVLLVAKGFSGEDANGLSTRARELQGSLGNTGATSLGGTLRALSTSFGALFAALSGDQAGQASTTLSDIAGGVQVLANGITALATAYSKLSAFTKSSGYQKTLDAIFGSKNGKYGSVLNPFGNNFLGASNLINLLGGGSPATSKPLGVPKMAKGGFVKKPTLAMIGDAGPEVVIPLSKMGQAGGGGNTYNVTVNAGMGTNGTQVGREIVDAIKKFERSSGPVFKSA